MNNKKITIGIFNDSFYPMADGVISVIDNYAKRLCKVANVIVFVPKYHEHYNDSIFPYTVVRCSSVKVPFLDYSVSTPNLDIKYIKEVNKYKLDIVHIHSPFTIGYSGLRYAKKHHIPVVATMHSQFKQDFKRAVKTDYMATKLNDIVIKFFNDCDECWAVNKEVARIFYEDYHYKCMPRVMNNATEMLPVKNIEEAKNTINKLHKINKKDNVFLFVGRINILKNILFIADSLKIVKDKNPDFNFKMIYVGSGADEDKLKKHIKSLGLTKDVILAGKITDRDMLAKYYARADLFLFPSVYDASSIVQIEAASQKTPGIFLEGTATAATITDNVNGYLSDNSTFAYADKIIEAMENEKKYKKISENCFKQIYKNWDEAVSEAYKLYIDLINKKLY